DKVDLNTQSNICFVEGINGEQLPTSTAFKNFLTWYELEIAADSGEREYIDATEGGARIKGTTIMPLREVIEKYCIQPVPHLSQIVPEGEFDAEKYRRAYEELEKLNQVFDNIRAEANRQILRLDKLENKIVKNKGNLSPTDLEKIYKVLNKAKKLEDLILYNDIARTLFQAPLMMAAAQVRMLGNEINTQNTIKNLKIQKKMVASVIVGCYSVQNSLLQIIKGMKNEELIGHKEEEGRENDDELGAKSYAGNLGNCQ
ncbi:MAG TPA: motility associated factor glycosyltransferase family protein, partial [Clostridia bacterium]|nr:motility associated factor glycosyltransferase family protein [Clostridia bacterium]